MPTDRQFRILIGGVGYRWAGDASFGLVVTDELARVTFAEDVDVRDLGYGAIYVSQDIAATDAPYDRVVFVTAAQRGKQMNTLHVYRWGPQSCSADDLQARIREAGAGVIDIDHLLAIAQHFRALPPDVVLVEYEYDDSTSGDGLSAPAQRAAEEAICLIRDVLVHIDAKVDHAVMGEEVE